MREFAITLAQNLGTGELGKTLDVTQQRVEIGPWRWEVDKDLTKLSPGDLSIKLADLDGSIWAWIQSHLQSTAGLLPPFVTVDVDGRRMFLGLIDPSKIQRVPRTCEIAFTAQDWSTQLTSRYLGADNADDDDDPKKNPWCRPAPMVSEQVAGKVDKANFLYFGKGSLYYLLPILVLPPWVEDGDRIELLTLPGKIFKAIRSQKASSCMCDGCMDDYCAVVSAPKVVSVNQQPHPLWINIAFRRLESPTSTTNYYIIKQSVDTNPPTPCHSITLNSIDGIVPGDELVMVQSAKSHRWTVLQVDPQTQQIITHEEVRDVLSGDLVYFSKKTKEEQVFMDARKALMQCLDLKGYSVDFSRYHPLTVGNPVLTWLPLRQAKAGADLTSIKDLDAGLSSVRLYGMAKLLWEGTVKEGWQTSQDTGLKAVWTDQLLNKPISLMPDDTYSIEPTTPRRNRAIDLRYRRQIPFITDTKGVDSPDPKFPWNPQWAATPGTLVIYNYLRTCRLEIGGRDITLTRREWYGGGGWSNPATSSLAELAGPGNVPLSASVYPPDTCVLLILFGDHQGNNGVLHAKDLYNSFAYKTSTPVDAKDARLVMTPWGAYLVGSRGYGRVYVNKSNGAVSITWCNILAPALSGTPAGSTLYPNTFCALDENQCFVLARIDGQGADGKAVTETHAMVLAATPKDAKGSVLWKEPILDGAPITLGAMRDPSGDRIIGHCGGRLFQFSKALPAAYALERFKPSGMKAAELIEHICQVLHCVAVPDPNGTLHIISRALLETPVELTVENLSIVETRNWEHHYTYVRVSGEKEDCYADVPRQGEVVPLGGKLLEVSNHPLLWTLSGCEAMARALHSFFSVPRRCQTQTWIHTDPNTAAPWESLPPLARLRINGDKTQWLLIGIEDHKTRGEAHVKLLEVF